MLRMAMLLVLLAPATARAWVVPPPPATPPTLLERALVEAALGDSPWSRDDLRDPWRLLSVLRVEARPELSVPPEARGMLLAVSYRESVWQIAARGDSGRSHGWFQVQRWHARSCNGPDLDDPVSAGMCWLSRVRATYERKVSRRCGAGPTAWNAAWQWVARPLPGGRFPGCDNRVSTHWRALRRWRRAAAARLISTYERRFGPACSEGSGAIERAIRVLDPTWPRSTSHASPRRIASASSSLTSPARGR